MVRDDGIRYGAAIGVAQERIRSLQRDREALEELAAEVRRGQSLFSQQMQRRRAMARRASQLGKSGMGRRFGERFATCASLVESGAQGSFSNAHQALVRALAEVDLSIAQERAIMRQNERALARLRAYEAR